MQISHSSSNFQFLHIFIYIQFFKSKFIRYHLFIQMYTLHPHFSVRSTSNWLLCLFDKTPSLIKYFFAAWQRMFQVHVPFSLHQTWNQSIFEDPWFCLVQDNIQKPRSGCQADFLLEESLCFQELRGGPRWEYLCIYNHITKLFLQTYTLKTRRSQLYFQFQFNTITFIWIFFFSVLISSFSDSEKFCSHYL